MVTLPQDVFCLMFHSVCFKDLNNIWIQLSHLLHCLILLQCRIFHEPTVIIYIYTLYTFINLHSFLEKKLCLVPKAVLKKKLKKKITSSLIEFYSFIWINTMSKPIQKFWEHLSKVELQSLFNFFFFPL